MVATQVLISLCVAAGLTAAAPQLNLPGVQRTVTTVATNGVNEETLITDVVTALEPSIAAAVANALRSLQTSSSFTTGSDSTQTGGASGFSSEFSSSSLSSSSSSAAKSSAAAASKAAAAEKAAFEREFAAGRGESAEPTTRPEYNFEFKVADSDEQTYITQQETRDGDELTGSYSYVDPTGALITVNYQAGPMGFSQTTDTQEGFVQIVAKPPKIAAAGSASASLASGSKFSNTGSSSGSSSGFSSGSSSGSSFNNGGAAFSSQASNAASASSSLDQSTLIAQILAALQPQISASVNAALTSSQSSRATQSVIAVPAAPAPLTVAARPVQAARPAQAAGGNLASLFGDGYAVRIATPEFKIEY